MLENARVLHGRTQEGRSILPSCNPLHIFYEKAFNTSTFRSGVRRYTVGVMFSEKNKKYVVLTLSVLPNSAHRLMSRYTTLMYVKSSCQPQNSPSVSTSKSDCINAYQLRLLGLGLGLGLGLELELGLAIIVSKRSQGGVKTVTLMYRRRNRRGDNHCEEFGVLHEIGILLLLILHNKSRSVQQYTTV